MMRCDHFQIITCICWILLQIINGYLAAVPSKHTGLFVMNSHLVTAVITRQTNEMSKSLLKKDCVHAKYYCLCNHYSTNYRVKWHAQHNKNHWVLVVRYKLNNDNLCCIMTSLR